jgi:cell division protein FtsX
MELKDLEKMTVNRLREELAKFEDVEGVTGMKKAQLIDALCQKLDIGQAQKVVVGIDKPTLKARIRNLKTEREKAVAAHDHKALADIRKRIKTYRRSIKKHTVANA